MVTITADYDERVYAGVLGKIIGVYVGRPFEGWSHDRVLAELGEIQYYVHEKLNKPLIVIDDDISGTFAFLRAMPDYGNTMALTAEQIGQSWLNYLVEKQTVLWWGGMGNSTEHTAYLRLKAGVKAPQSGSIALNGKVVAEQIGAQIFIDGWGMISPGDPEQAAALARKAASVSHDGEAIYGAQVVAAMEAQAFVEADMHKLLDVGVSVIPKDSLIYRMIGDLRDWRAKYTSWYDCFYRVVANYGYDKYGGNCHMVPNHAVVIMSWLYCSDSFSKAMTIVNTAGWDTDCNSGNVGCLMGIKNGLAGLEDGPDWRTPVADRMYITTAEGGRTVTDALAEAVEVARIGRALAQAPRPAPKQGARYHFDMPGALQGFLPEESIAVAGTTTLENVAGHSLTGARALAIRYRGLAQGRVSRVECETYPDYDPQSGYRMVASPTLYPGQMLTARLTADAANATPVKARLYIKVYGAEDALVMISAPQAELQPGGDALLRWQVEAPVGCPIAKVGLEIASGARAEGTVYLDWLTWEGAPTLKLDRPAHRGRRWADAWVHGCSAMLPNTEHTYRVIQDEGTGLLIQGTRDWRDYTVRATCTPHMAAAFGLAARVQGLRRYYALKLVAGGKAQLVRELDGTHVLAEAPFAWELYQSYAFELTIKGDQISGGINGQALFEQRDASLLDAGAIALLAEVGRVGCDAVQVMPVEG
jgi:ADP-ribosylglycohydrolase